MKAIDTGMVPAARRTKAAISSITPDQSFTEVLYNGRSVVFKAMVIPPHLVDKMTLVYSHNERDQTLLTEEALADILPSVRAKGITTWARGRMLPEGVIEVADGSRRRMSAILAGKEYKILVGDLTDEEMEVLSVTGNFYRSPSYIEKGRRYARLERLLGSLRKAEEYLQAQGEQVSRRVMSRCIDAARVPKEVLDCFTSPATLKLDSLLALLPYCFADMGKAEKPELSRHMAKAIEMAKGFSFDNDEALAKYLLQECELTLGMKKPKAEKAKGAEVRRSYGDGRVKVAMKGGSLRLDVAKVDEKELQEIEQFISMLLDAKQDKESA